MASETPAEGMDVRVDITEEQLRHFWDADFETHLEEHEGASFHTVYRHDEYGLIAFSVFTCPGDADLKIAYTRWNTEPHHEADREIYVRERER